MPSSNGASASGFDLGFHVGTLSFFFGLAIATYAVHTSHLVLDRGYLIWAALLLRDTQVRFGWRHGVAGIYLLAVLMMLLFVPDRLHSVWLFSAFLVIRLASVAVRDWLFCDGPPDREAALLNFNLVRLGCYFMTLGTLFAANAVRANVRFDAWLGYIVLKVLLGVVFLTSSLYLIGQGWRQSLLSLCWKLLWPIRSALEALILNLYHGIENAHSQLFGSPAGHWWHESAFHAGETGEQYNYTESRILFPDRAPGSRQQEPTIRLLKLQKRWPFGNVYGRLLPLSLAAAEALHYDAISYSWGKDKRKDHGIFLNNKYMAITKNAYEVLHGRSSYFRDRYLWIDAICVDQDNTLEKNFQIPLMKEVYSRSKRTVVWLGYRKSASHVIDLFLELVMAQQRYMLSNSELHARFKSQRRSPKFIALAELLENEWFTRAWVIQEVAMAKKVHVIYGGQYLDWSLLIAGLKVMLSPQMVLLLTSTTKPLFLRNIPRGLIHAMNIDELRNQVQSKEPLSLAKVLHNSFQCHATEPKDQVFALHGLVLPELPGYMIPDYFATTEDVYLRTSQYLLPHGYLTLILPFAGVGHMRKIRSLPSWVPDWSEIPRAVNLTEERPDMRSTYNASKSLTQPLQSCDRTLNLKCIYVAKVLEDGLAKHNVHCSLEDDIIDSLAMKESLKTVYTEALSLAQSRTNGIYGTDASLTDAFWRTLVGDTTTEGDHPAPGHWSQYYEIACRFNDMGPDLLHSALNDDPDSIQQLQAITPEDSIKATKFNTASGARINYRRFCVTEQGLMGWVPLLTLPGDIVVVIIGAKVPFILRPVGRRSACDAGVEGAAYEIVGECYMHGIMDGYIMSAAQNARDFLIV